jgi:hypothetical protein
MPIDPDAGVSGPVLEAREMSQPQANTHGTLTPFILPLPMDTISHTVTRDKPSARRRGRVDSEGRDTIAEVLQHVQQLERVVLLEGQLSGERDRDQRVWTSTYRNSDDSFEIRSDGTSDPPPTYRES